MKLKIMQYGKMLPGMSYEQVIGAWAEKLSALPEEIETEIVRDDGNWTGDRLDELVADADALLGLRIEQGILTEGFWKRHPALKYIGTLSHAYAEFDKEVSRRYGVTITNTVYGVPTIAEYTWAMIFQICGGMPFQGKTLGVIGQGAIGRQVAAIGKVFGMRILTWDPLRKKEGLEQLLSEADIISLNARVVSETRKIICRDSIRKMKEGVFLVNTARGTLIDEMDLYDALMERKIRAAGLDVFSEEPPKVPGLLIQCPYCRTTGHIAWMTQEAVYRTIELGINNFLSYLKGNPVCVINQEKEHELEPY